ncbi:hypothetical protein [Virgibacillus salinus]|uniref:Uncharacterized protein n=1 Tax=Virgibacillus salinus TaxID=553311 RepID=A0A1H0XUW8_9BACI|nr:hypothetical protein [Virgibacillus salinus]SDQ06682.1 hypothetical protein SAMN05216231_0225 [Virgibacillus salinus]
MKRRIILSGILEVEVTTIQKEGVRMSYVSFYQIVKELEDEKHKDATALQSDEYSQKVSDYSRKFKEILDGVHVDIDYFKGSKGYQFPEASKSAVKTLLSLYTSSPMKRVRKGNVDDLSFKEIQEIIECIKELLSNTLCGKTLLGELNKLEAISQYSFKKSNADLKDQSLDTLSKDAKELLTSMDGEWLSPEDRMTLVDYQKQELKQLTEKIKRVATFMSLLREKELMEQQEQESQEIENQKKKIHVQVAKEIVRMNEKKKNKPTEEMKEDMSVRELVEWTGLSEGKILTELNKLLHEKESKQFTLVTYKNEKDADVRTSKDILLEAIQTYNEDYK